MQVLCSVTAAVASCSGFNSSETKIRTPDGKVWGEEDFHNLSREIYRDLTRQLTGSTHTHTHTHLHRLSLKCTDTKTQTGMHTHVPFRLPVYNDRVAAVSL